MPEWPDLHVLRRRLDNALTGRTTVTAEVFNPIVLRAVLPLPQWIAGRRLAGLSHRGKFLTFHWDDASLMVVNPMLTGHFALTAPGAKRTKDTAFTISFEGDVQLRYRDEKQMGKVYLLRGEDPEKAVPGFAGLGPEADPATFDEQDFIQRGRKRQYEVRNLLMDQEFLAGIGNAYADEILFEARLHPKRKATSLSAEEWADLARAVRTVVALGVRAVEDGLPPGLGVKVRTHMQVRGRENTPCPRCGTRIVLRSLGYLETNFCPGCQPAPPGQLY
ncbi:MAG TPA: DNA-formamidopyrimidine glycosylase family protein [Symbiobacteriaceae bacterium]|nr:DNA-formamidopyrimidine glycosylase family protein [Symbiobacteriaceae bacterium]